MFKNCTCQTNFFFGKLYVATNLKFYFKFECHTKIRKKTDSVCRGSCPEKFTIQIIYFKIDLFCYVLCCYLINNNKKLKEKCFVISESMHLSSNIFIKYKNIEIVAFPSNKQSQLFFKFIYSISLIHDPFHC